MYKLFQPQFKGNKLRGVSVSIRTQRPIFSVVTTAKGETDEDMIRETFESWSIARESFERRIGRRNLVEFIMVDAGGNVDLSGLVEDHDIRNVSFREYSEYKDGLYSCGEILRRRWDSQSIGLNLGLRRARGELVVFQDIDTLMSTGTDFDDKYVVPELDGYDNYLEAMYKEFRARPIVLGAPSLRARYSRSRVRRLGMRGMNFMTWLSTRLPSFTLFGIPFSLRTPGPSITCRRDFAQRVAYYHGNRTIEGPYHPELAMGQDYLFSGSIGMYGKASYVSRAGAFTRTTKRVGGGRFGVLRFLYFGLKWSPHYIFPGVWRYKRYDLSI
ncbi:MAG: glycosyltransferase family A protein [Candidatus Bathyarchaeia archaeon]